MFLVLLLVVGEFHFQALIVNHGTVTCIGQWNGHRRDECCFQGESVRLSVKWTLHLSSLCSWPGTLRVRGSFSPSLSEGNWSCTSQPSPPTPDQGWTCRACEEKWTCFCRSKPLKSEGCLLLLQTQSILTDRPLLPLGCSGIWRTFLCLRSSFPLE